MLACALRHTKKNCRLLLACTYSTRPPDSKNKRLFLKTTNNSQSSSPTSTQPSISPTTKHHTNPTDKEKLLLEQKRIEQRRRAARIRLKEEEKEEETEEEEEDGLEDEDEEGDEREAKSVSSLRQGHEVRGVERILGAKAGGKGWDAAEQEEYEENEDGEYNEGEGDEGDEGEEGEDVEEYEEGDEGEAGEEDTSVQTIIAPHLQPSDLDTPEVAHSKSIGRAFARLGLTDPEEIKKEDEVLRERKNKIPNRFARQIELARDSETAALIFEKAKKAGMANIHVYNQMIKQYAIDGQTVKVTKLLHEMRKAEQDVRPTFHTYNSLILLYAKQGKLKKVVDLYHLLIEDGMTPTSRTYNILILSFAKHGALDKAIDILKLMKTEKARKKQATYTAVSYLIIASLIPSRTGENTKFDLPYLVKRFAEKGVDIDPVFALDGLLRSGHRKEGVTFVEAVLKQGYSFFNSSDDYHSLISSFAESQKPTRALDIFDTLRAGGMKPSDIPFNFLLKRFTEVGKDMIAAVYLGKLESLGYPVDADTYNIVLQSHRKNELWDDAFKLVDNMLEKKVIPNVQTYTILIDIYGEKQEPNKILDLVELIKAKGLTPSLQTYALAIKGLKRSKRVGHAASLLIEMSQAGHHVSIQAANALLAALSPQEHYDLIPAIREIIFKEKQHIASKPPTLPSLDRALKAHRKSKKAKKE